MSFELMSALYDGLREIAADNAAWVVVLTGRRPRLLLGASTSRTPA
jgi:enoyl-CoA hydratase/carnithine racemase